MRYKKEIEQMYDSMHEALLSYAIASTKSRSQAEELVQETFRIACEKEQDVCTSPNPRGWMMQTMKNLISNAQRRQENTYRILRAYVASQIPEHSFAEDRLELEVLYEDITELEEFHLLKEMVIDGKSHKELARERGISVDACKKRVQRAKEILRRKWVNDVTFQMGRDIYGIERRK